MSNTVQMLAICWPEEKKWLGLDTFLLRVVTTCNLALEKNSNACAMRVRTKTTGKELDVELRTLRSSKWDAAPWQHVDILNSIVLTNSRLPSPWVTKAVLTHPRGTCTPRICSRQNGQWWHVFQQMTVLSSHVQVVWGVFSKMSKQLHRMIVCLKFFEGHQIFRNTPRVKSIGYSTMAVFLYM